MATDNTHLQEAQKLEAEAIIDMYEFKLKGTSTYIRFKNNDAVTWQGMTFESVPCQLSGDTRTADEEEPRPTLTVGNPEGAFSKMVYDGNLDNAVLTRYRVLRPHVTANLNISQTRMWFVARTPNMIRGKGITFSLRNMTEGANFQLPVRMFLPPEFPTVTLR